MSLGISRSAFAAFVTLLLTPLCTPFAQTSPVTSTPPSATASPSSVVDELVIDQIKKTVAFLEGTFPTTISQTVNGVLTQVPDVGHSAGTGFFISVSEPRLGERGVITYLVTNKHVIRQPGPPGTMDPGPYFKSINARLNTVQTNGDGTQFGNLSVLGVDDSGSLEWLVDTKDDTVDLAVTPVVLNRAIVDYMTIPTELFVTDALLKKERVNENDEIIFAGLFAWNPGAKKNYPIVRHGKLARLFEERIPLDKRNPEKTTEVHLADVMSFGGNSGSPVFVRVGGIREGAHTLLAGYSYYLLGVMQGFFPEGMDFAIDVVQLRGAAAQNSGIAGVIPSKKIIDLLESPRGQAYRERVVAASYERKASFKEAEQCYQTAISLLETSSPEHSDLAAALTDYAKLLRGHKRDSEASSLKEKAKRILSRVGVDLSNPKM